MNITDGYNLTDGYSLTDEYNLNIIYGWIDIGYMAGHNNVVDVYDEEKNVCECVCMCVHVCVRGDVCVCMRTTGIQCTLYTVSMYAYARVLRIHPYVFVSECTRVFVCVCVRLCVHVYVYAYV